MTRRRLKRGVFHSLVDLQAAINRYLAEHNADPKPFVWTATSQKIIAKLQHVNASVRLQRLERVSGRPTLHGGDARARTTHRAQA